jgi:hypothetical protein
VLELLDAPPELELAIGSAATCRRRQMRRLFLAHVEIELCGIILSWRS